MSRLRRYLSFANVTACIALFVALGGAAYAAGITGDSIVNHTITGKDIKKGSIPLTALKTLPVGEEGKRGPAGPAGPTGPAGAQGAPGSAVAYAHVNADGTLDAANSKNIASTSQSGQTGYYCVSPSVSVRNVVATPSGTIGGAQIIAGFEDFFTSCPPNAAIVQTFDKGGGYRSTPFYVLFN